jgi:hypothetical protein
MRPVPSRLTGAGWLAPGYGVPGVQALAQTALPRHCRDRAAALVPRHTWPEGLWRTQEAG